MVIEDFKLNPVEGPSGAKALVVKELKETLRRREVYFNEGRLDETQAVDREKDTIKSSMPSKIEFNSLATVFSRIFRVMKSLQLLIDCFSKAIANKVVSLIYKVCKLSLKKRANLYKKRQVTIQAKQIEIPTIEDTTFILEQIKTDMTRAWITVDDKRIVLEKDVEDFVKSLPEDKKSKILENMHQGIVANLLNPVWEKIDIDKYFIRNASEGDYRKKSLTSEDPAVIKIHYDSKNEEILFNVTEEILKYVDDDSYKIGEIFFQGRLDTEKFIIEGKATINLLDESEAKETLPAKVFIFSPTNLYYTVSE